ncbi:hypothetical protein GPECTOR_27g695 [Gonium pectorale]|uniref:Uncharacterized protein n=1 Tax=Gonium pectorale TaxID=33097 RepID=A0A150GFB9_GONPE|nr:hypothetical protein GPECTOR_27g695 [Gonium pectorale]|eukprot:KXZ48524.1 hypothetical protein GPECTOR_27g695 [Gonium pectorale]
MSASLFEVIQAPVLELAEGLQGALLYLDSGAGEIAATTLGLPFLLGLGVTHVCSLEAASPDDAALPLLTTGRSPDRLAIITTMTLSDAHPHVLRAVLAHPAVSSVAIHTSVSQHAHATCAEHGPGSAAGTGSGQHPDPAAGFAGPVSDLDLGVEAYSEYAELLQDQVRRARAASATSASASASAQHQPPQPPPPPAAATAPLRVSVSFLPLLAAVLDPGLAVLPAAGSVARRGWPEVFALGPVSGAIAAELSSLPPVAVGPSAGGSPGAGSLAVVLIDRALDLVTPCSPTDHPWDLLLAAAAERQAAAALAEAPAAGSAPPPGARRRAALRPTDLRLAAPRSADDAGGAPLELLLPPPPGDLLPSSSAAAPSRLLYGVEVLDPTDRASVARIEVFGWRGGASAGGGAAAAAVSGSSVSGGGAAAAAAGAASGGGTAATTGSGRREALAALRRALKEALRAEKLTPAVRSKAGAVQPAELRGLAEALAAAPGAATRHRGLIALALAAADVIVGPAAEAAAGLGRALLAAAVAGGGGEGGAEAIVATLLDAVESSKRRCG